MFLIIFFFIFFITIFIFFFIFSFFFLFFFCFCFICPGEPRFYFFCPFIRNNFSTKPQGSSSYPRPKNTFENSFEKARFFFFS
ncbi:TPA: hypothetical protein DIC40_04815 [Patescibacteria group bacterium]|nr:hypothetical protein [Candidatus Gracilibacteria bacterium]